MLCRAPSLYSMPWTRLDKFLAKRALERVQDRPEKAKMRDVAL